MSDSPDRSSAGDPDRPSDVPAVDPARAGASTRAIHAGRSHPALGDPVVPPLIQSATFFGGRGGDDEELRYTRYGNNPTQRLLGRKLAALEGTEAALPVASGMAATSLAVLSVVEAGDHVVASRHLYGATRKLLEFELPRRGVETTFVDPREGGSVWSSALRERTRLLFLEVPTNPGLRVFDPRPAVAAARDVGAATAVDATFASPVNLRPAKLGVDLVVHSATKYLGGHSDLIAGVVSGSAERIRAAGRLLALYGPAIDPHAAWLLDRGLRTLPLRVARQNETALELARWLRGRDGVVRVIHPGLDEHPDHALAAELLDGFGGMLSFVLEGGGEAADRFCEALRIGLLAPSLGGVETLVSQPRHTSHRDMSPDERAADGIPDGFVRISVGVEDADDLRADLERGLEAAATPSP